MSSSAGTLHPLPHIPLPPIPDDGLVQRMTDDCYVDESSERIRWVRDRIVAGAASPLISLLNIQWTSISMHKCVCQMTIDRRHLQPFGLVHGGMNALLAEHVGSMMGILHSSTGCVGVSVDAHHVSSAAPGDVLIAEGTPIRIGHTLALWKIVVTARSGGDTVASPRLVAVCKLLTMRRPSRAVQQIQKQEQKVYTAHGISNNIVRPITDQPSSVVASAVPSPPRDEAQHRLEAEQSQTLINCNQFHVTQYIEKLDTTRHPYSPVSPTAHIAAGMSRDFKMSPLATLIGFQYTHISPQRLEGEVKIGLQHMQPFAIANGGLAAVLAEELGSGLSAVQQQSTGSSSAMPRVGSWVEVQHLGSAFGDDVVRGSATILKAGRQSQLLQIDVYARSPTSTKERHIASCQLTTIQPLPRTIKAKV